MCVRDGEYQVKEIPSEDDFVSPANGQNHRTDVEVDEPSMRHRQTGQTLKELH